MNEGTVNARIAKYQELREKIATVEDAMGQAATDCKVYIDELQEIITAIEIDEDDIEIFCTEANEFINIKKLKKEKEQAQEASEPAKEPIKEENEEFTPMTIPVIPLDIEEEEKLASL